MLGKIFLTDIGIISAVGRIAEGFLCSLKNDGSSVGSITQLDTIHKGE
jgi:hypothetical protein